MATAKYMRAIDAYREDLLLGTILSIDPSCGSEASMPGWALFRGGIRVDSGVIEIPRSRELHRRLQFLRQWLMNIEEKIDLVLVEAIPTQRYGRGRNQISHASLLKAVGVTIASVPCEHVLYVPIPTWRSYVERTYGTNYKKSDENDAIMMGEAIIAIAQSTNRVEGEDELDSDGHVGQSTRRWIPPDIPRSRSGKGTRNKRVKKKGRGK